MTSTRSILAAAMALLTAGVVAQTQVQRCEGKDGSVTYSNRECPAGTSPVRKVNTAPAITVPDGKAAQERAKKDIADVKQLDKEQKQREAEEKKAAEKRAKAELKIADRCERARRELAQAVQARSALDARAAKIDEMQKAAAEVSKREAELPKHCPT